MKRPFNTLFMLQSVDGKISTGYGKNMDFDKDLNKIDRLKDGMEDYYSYERHTDYWSLVTDRILYKLGAEENNFLREYHEHGFILWYNGHCSSKAVQHVAENCQQLLIVKPWGIDLNIDMSVHVNTRIYETGDIHNVEEVMLQLKSVFGIDCITVQSGGTLNAAFLRAGMVDRVVTFVAPVICGGKDTPTLADGSSFNDSTELVNMSELELHSVEQYAGGFLKLTYDVLRPLSLV